jgi:hypothetical protein
MKCIPLIVIWFSCSLVACKRLSDKLHPADKETKDLSKVPGINAGAGRFNVTAPPGWKNFDTTINGIKFRFVMAPRSYNNLFTPNMNILSEKMNGASLNDYFAGAKKGVRSMRDFEEIGTGRKEIHGMPGMWMQYNCTSKSGTKMELIFTMFVADDIVYDVTMATAKGEMNKFKPSFDSVLNSFTLGRPVPQAVR